MCRVASAPLAALGGPSRPADARWRRAVALSANHLPPGAADDVWVTAAVDYLRTAPVADANVLSPAVAAAYRLYADPDAWPRAVLEAWLLAGLPPGQAASRGGLPPAAGAAYAALFFDVAGRLHACGFILGQAIGPQVWAGLTEDDPGAILRYLGYVKG